MAQVGRCFFLGKTREHDAVPLSLSLSVCDVEQKIDAPTENATRLARGAVSVFQLSFFMHRPDENERKTRSERIKLMNRASGELSVDCVNRLHSIRVCLMFVDACVDSFVYSRHKLISVEWYNHRLSSFPVRRRRRIDVIREQCVYTEGVLFSLWQAQERVV